MWHTRLQGATARGRLPAAIVPLAAIAIDGLTIAALVTGWLPALLAAPLHLATVAGAWAAFAGRPSEITFAPLFAMALAALGPVGALACVLNRVLIRPRAAAELEDWHQTIIDRPQLDPAEALYQQISEGRAYEPARPPRSFHATMADGSVEDRQRMLGVLVRQPLEPVEPLILEGLSARELAVRAPAAAVMARLREHADDHPRIQTEPA